MLLHLSEILHRGARKEKHGLMTNTDNRLDLTDIRDDGNDPLRQIIAQACGFIEGARQGGGSILVHCVSPLSFAAPSS